jgi:hypothetical protein
MASGGNQPTSWGTLVLHHLVIIILGLLTVTAVLLHPVFATATAAGTRKGGEERESEEVCRMGREGTEEKRDIYIDTHINIYI